MARTRSIKPGFFDNDILGDLPPLTRLLFIGLWCMADREGRLEDRPRKIKKAILGYDDVDSDGVSQMLQELHDNDFITRYQVGGNGYIQVLNFSKHQNPHMKEKESEIPPPDELPRFDYEDESSEEDDLVSETGDECEGDTSDAGSTVQAPDKHSSSPAGTLLPSTGTLLPSTLPPGGKGKGKRADQSNAQLEQTFELFFAAYPKKRSKQDALKAWMKIRPAPALFTKIMEAIGRARVSKQWLKDNGEFIPYPGSWLRAGGWDDVYEEAKTNGANRENAGESSFKLGGFKPANEPEDSG